MLSQSVSKKNLPYYCYSLKKKQELQHMAKYKLIILLLKRAIERVVKNALTHIFETTKKQTHKLQRVVHLAEINVTSSKVIAWQKLKANTIHKKLKIKSLKNCVKLTSQLQKYSKKDTFTKIYRFSQKKKQIIVQKLDIQRRSIFCKKVQIIYYRKKKENLDQIKRYVNFQKRKMKKVRIASIIAAQYLKNIKQACFNRLMKFNKKQKQGSLEQISKPSPRYIQQRNNAKFRKEHEQNEQLKIQLQDMTIKLENKNQSIGRLQEEINELKAQQAQFSINNYNSFSQYTTLMSHNNLNSSRTRSAKKINQNNISADSSGMDFSIGSILGRSFTSLGKSRDKSFRKTRKSGQNDSIISGDCNCGYKQKYMKYKNSNQSLKNQLQIVKEELQVAKDLNDHFTNEIKQFFGGQKEEIQLQRMKKQVKDLQRQREQLRMKVSKYQNHVKTLKNQFRLKIQQLYRKVKKER